MFDGQLQGTLQGMAVPGEWGRSTQEVARYRMVDVEYPLGKLR